MAYANTLFYNCKKNMKKVYTVKSFLPPIKKYIEYTELIWKNNQLTNQGPLLKELELKLQKYLKIKKLHFVTNGTIALQLALNSLDITEGEIITTPFSYVATTSSILWGKCTPIFVDIDPKTLCIDSNKIENAITKKTKAIMAVHVFGYPCDVEKIKTIAKKHKLKIIYDGAHAFGCSYKNKSLLDYGDISICSFHATKIFHTIEGGCLVAKDKKINERIELIKRFGHNQDDHILLGVNAKASEFQAAMGLCNIEHVKKIIKSREKLSNLYDKLLKNYIVRPAVTKKFKYNFAYYPVIFKDEKQTLSIIKILNKENIYPRRYFYPSLNKLPYIKKVQKCPVSENISSRILCLPLYTNLNIKTVKRICKIIKNNI
jgi:dTDP-4-amino-4,6-dideoxygalactose transaminase